MTTGFRIVSDIEKVVPKDFPCMQETSNATFAKVSPFPCHFGQKKLFYALFDFLTKCAQKFDLDKMSKGKEKGKDDAVGHSI